MYLHLLVIVRICSYLLVCACICLYLPYLLVFACIYWNVLAFAWMCLEWFKFGKPSALGAVTGMVAGLGTIAPASGFVGPGGALIIGLAAGVICFNATIFLEQKLGVDDSLDVFPVHGVGGALGTILVAVFASSAASFRKHPGCTLLEGIRVSPLTKEEEHLRQATFVEHRDHARTL